MQNPCFKFTSIPFFSSSIWILAISPFFVYTFFCWLAYFCCNARWTWCMNKYSHHKRERVYVRRVREKKERKKLDLLKMLSNHVVWWRESQQCVVCVYVPHNFFFVHFCFSRSPHNFSRLVSKLIPYAKIIRGSQSQQLVSLNLMFCLHLHIFLSNIDFCDLLAIYFVLVFIFIAKDAIHNFYLIAAGIDVKRDQRCYNKFHDKWVAADDFVFIFAKIANCNCVNSFFYRNIEIFMDDLMFSLK